MSLIEDQRRAVAAEIAAARNEARRAEQAAESQRAIYKWSKANSSWSCEANLHLLVEYLANAGIQVSEDSLDLALRACRNNLAERVPTPVLPELSAEEKRMAHNARLRAMSVEELRAELKSDIKRKLASPEYGGWGSVYTPPFTATQFLKMSPSEVKDLLHFPGSRQERPGRREGIDRLLREAGKTRPGF